jgi:hypothetical protein
MATMPSRSPADLTIESHALAGVGESLAGPRGSTFKARSGIRTDLSGGPSRSLP